MSPVRVRTPEPDAGALADWPLDDTNICSYRVGVVLHQYEARCACGQCWRVYRERDEDDDDDDAMATCVACGADTFDLTDVGELRSAGRDVNP